MSDLIDALGLDDSVTLSPSQADAAQKFQDFILDEDARELTITGFAGSGKSFLVKYLTELLDELVDLNAMLEEDKSKPVPNVYYTATTNKAAEVLREMIDGPAGTIHSFLGLSVKNDYKTGKQKLKQKRSVAIPKGSIIFIDEASMISHELMVHIKRHTKDCKVIYIGDSYQLPPVMSRPANIFSEDKREVARLTEIQRQVAGSPIIQLSAGYRNVLDDPDQEWPDIGAFEDGNKIRHYTNKHDFFYEILQAYSQPHDHEDLKIIAWSNQRVRNYNRWIRNQLGRVEDFEPGEVLINNNPVVDGDQVLIRTDALVEVAHVTEVTDLLPGYSIALKVSDQRMVTAFQPKNWKQAQVYLNKLASKKMWHEYFSYKESWADLRPVHALTAHKSQGSTYGQVFVDLEDISRNNNWQEVARLVYVAISRAKQRVHIYGDITGNYPTKETAKEKDEELVRLQEAFNAAPRI